MRFKKTRATSGNRGSSRREPKRNRSTVEFEQLESRELFVVGAFQIPAAVAPATGYDGVVQTVYTSPLLNTTTCTGSLMTTGRHILTAAHCVDTNDDGRVDAGTHSVRFDLPGRSINMTATQVDVPSSWNGNYEDGSDIAILTLPSLAPSGPQGIGADRYDIYRDRNEVGQTFNVVGYGRTGTGSAGAFLGGGVKRAGSNVFIDSESQLLEFKFGKFVGEGFIAPGDSGGPDLIAGKIAGVNSYVHENNVAGGSPEFEFGEYGYSTRVSSFANWIDSTVSGAYDLVLDMNTQLVGGNGGADTIDIRRGGTWGESLEVVVNGSVYHSDNLFSVRSITVRGSSDNERFSLSHPDFLNVSFDGRGGSDTLDAPDSNNLWQITGTNRGRLGSRVGFANIESLNGGSGNDTFRFRHGARVNGQIKGEGGRDTLDYSGYQTGVYVNLQNYRATGTGSVFGMEDVIGGRGNDTLYGDSGNNRLYGGRGADYLNGLDGDDLLDGGDDYAVDQLWGGNGRDTYIQHWWSSYGSGWEDSIPVIEYGDSLRIV